MKFARIEDDRVVEILDLPEGTDLETAFHPDIAASLRPCGDDVGEEWLFDGDDFIAPAIPSPDEAQLIDYAAWKRWQVETGGVLVSGAQVDTSRESQAMVSGAFTYSQVNPSKPIKFKAASGWITLDAATVALIAGAVGDHVQACFAIEEEVSTAILDGTITTTAEIDAADWPSSE